MFVILLLTFRADGAQQFFDVADSTLKIRIAAGKSQVVVRRIRYFDEVVCTRAPSQADC